MVGELVVYHNLPWKINVENSTVNFHDNESWNQKTRGAKRLAVEHVLGSTSFTPVEFRTETAESFHDGGVKIYQSSYNKLDQSKEKSYIYRLSMET